MKQYQVERVFAEKISGRNADSPELKAMLEYVREGDTLYIESISRLRRSTRDLLNIVDVLQRKGVTLVSSKENIDTNTPQGRSSTACKWSTPTAISSTSDTTKTIQVQ